jgi:shikimate dehydrogenase
MFPNVDTCPDLPYEALTAGHVCFDCVYNPAETLFMKNAARQGAAVKSGYEMLVGQAIESYRIWTES